MKYKAVALCRVSTSKQRIEGSSLEAQEVRVYDAAAYLEAEIVRLWSLDTSSKKGVNLKRKDLQEMLIFCKQNKAVRYLIVDEVDRFMRSIAEYYWYKVEFQQLGVEIRFASKPELSGEDQRAVFDEMIDIYRAESSNIERSTKTTDKMKAKIALGYYPGHPHIAYMKSETKGFHVPQEPNWSLLRGAMRKILYSAFTLHEALKWLNKNGFQYGNDGLDMDRFKKVLMEPYYAGIVKMSNWDVINEHGLHEAMITIQEYEQLYRIVSGKGKKFTIRKENPDFPISNVGMCENCAEVYSSRAMLVGYKHNNGKDGNSRKYYERYRCRVCNKAILKDNVHNGFDGFLSGVEFIEPKVQDLSKDLKRAWKDEVQDNTQTIARLKQKLELLSDDKDKLVRAIATRPELAEDFQDSLVKLKQEISSIEQSIVEAEDTDKDFEEFVDFALGFVTDMKDEFWALEREDKQRCKEIIFPGEFLVSRSGKVSTQELSKLFRYSDTKKEPQKALVYSNGGPGGT